MSHDANRLVVFNVGSLRFGIDVGMVQRVMPACEISPLLDAPDSVCGIVSIAGDIIAVIDSSVPFRRGAPIRPTLDSRFLLVQSPSRVLAYIADSVLGVREIPASALTAMECLPSGMSQIRDIASELEGLIYIFNPEGLISPADESDLSAAIKRAQE